MKKFITAFMLTVFFGSIASAKRIIVNNKQQLDSMNKVAVPGDTITLKNGNWANTLLVLTCNGTKEKPIVFKAETGGKVIFSGVSNLQIGGDFITVDGINFTNGNSPGNGVIIFRAKGKVANNCRVTNTVINNFNKPKRRSEEYWISFYGKNNRMDHCSVVDKKTFGVVIAVVMDDEKSRNSFHNIDHNYFGRRPALGSNTGEMIRVGVSQHCTFNSNTYITNNVFEKCDGETEIISIKSGGNVIRNNIFRECQGSLTLRHGNGNTVEGNIFLGNGKTATGGVRIINENQYVVNNYFYRCVGTNFRSPLVVMNGVPNSPPNRYLPVNNAVIANNTFVECSAMSLCEGSDAERSQAPKNVYVFHNSFINPADSVLYYEHDNMDGFNFSGNSFSMLKTKAPQGFSKMITKTENLNSLPFSNYTDKKLSIPLPNDLLDESIKDLATKYPQAIGAYPLSYFANILANEKTCGASWSGNAAAFKAPIRVPVKMIVQNGPELEAALATVSLSPKTIQLTGKDYVLDKTLEVKGNVTILQTTKGSVTFSNSNELGAVFMVKSGAAFYLKNVNADLTGALATHFISADTAGGPDHFSLRMENCTVANVKGTGGQSSIFFAPYSSFADSIVIRNCNFSNVEGAFYTNNMEKDNIGIYNSEHIKITENKFSGFKGPIIEIYRGGNDESTLGPNLAFTNNVVTDCESENPLFILTGVQKSNLSFNIITNCNTGKSLIYYKDIVRAAHNLKSNIIKNSGAIEGNNFLNKQGNLIQ